MKMKLFRTIAIVMALCLGWSAAGLMDSSALAGGGESHSHEHGDAKSADGGEHHGEGAAAHLAPHGKGIDWYKSMLVIAGSLFVAAVVIGIPAMKIKGPEPPDPADDHHDDHGHDDHGHDDDHSAGHGH